MNATKIEDGIYFLGPDGGCWVAAEFRGGKWVGGCEQSDAETHAAARDNWAGIIPSENDEEVDEDEARAIVAAVMPACDWRMVAVTRMVEPEPDVDEALDEVARVLLGHGEMFHGGNANDVAQDWIDHDFDAAVVGRWCEIGVWDASTAAEFRDAELSPSDVVEAAKSLPASITRKLQTDAIYAACNNDLSCDVIIEAAR